jgi:hypothetical protein
LSLRSGSNHILFDYKSPLKKKVQVFFSIWNSLKFSDNLLENSIKRSVIVTYLNILHNFRPIQSHIKIALMFIIGLLVTAGFCWIMVEFVRYFIQNVSRKICNLGFIFLTVSQHINILNKTWRKTSLYINIYLRFKKDNGMFICVGFDHLWNIC